MKKLIKEKIEFTVKTGSQDKVFGNISIKQLNAVAETTTTTNEDGTTTTTISIPSTVAPISTSNDVETVITSMITNDKILDEDDVKDIVDNKLTDYTTTSDLQTNYATKTLLTNTVDK